MLEDLSFEALAPDGFASSCLAYWIGTCDAAALQGAGAVGITRAMSYQYDVEEQADRTGVVMPEEVDWRASFTPVAPVQLARSWSPVPRAIEILGSPGWVSIESDGLGRVAACAWVSAGAADTEMVAGRERSPDHERFRRLLVVTLERARDSHQGILLAAKPGWSYDRAHAMGAGTRRLMERIGFVVQDRHA